MNRILLKLLFTTIVLIVFQISTLLAQDYFIEATFPTTGTERFSVCGGERDITIKLTNTTTQTLTKDTLIFNFPVGFQYSIGSLSGAGVSEVNSLLPSFAFDNVGPTQEVEFTIKVEVLCDGIANATGSANTSFSFDLKYTGGNSSQTYTSTFFEVVKPTLSVAQIDGQSSVNPPPINAGKFNTENVCVTVANGGNGVLSSFEYWVRDHPQMTLDSVYVTGFGKIAVDRVSGDTSYFVITSAMIANAAPNTAPGAEPNNTTLLQFNETLEICEYWFVDDCTLNAPDLERGIQYRCGTSYACESSRNLQGVRFGYTQPEMIVGFIQDFGRNTPTCVGDTLLQHGFYITNIGDEAMMNMKYSIVTNWNNNGYSGTLLDTAAIQFSTTSRFGPYFKYPIDYVRNYPYPNSTCLDELSNIAPITRASFDMKEDVVLMPGDTLFIKYAYKIGCACGDKNRNDRNRIEYDFRRAVFGYRNEDTRADNWTSITYSDGCNQFTYEDQYLRIYSLYYYFYTRGAGPVGTSYDGDEETVTFQAQRNIHTNAYANWTATNFTNDPPNEQGVDFYCQDCFQEYRYIFPKGVRWKGTNGDLNTTDWVFTDNDGDTRSPSLVDYRQSSGPDTLIIRLQGQIPSGFWASANSKLDINYEIDCGEAGCGFFSGVPIIEEAYFSISGEQCGTCFGRPDMVDNRESVPITFHCPCNPCDEGMIVKSVIPERRTFGLGDDNNNTIHETGETVDTTKIILNRIIPGDTVRVTFRGEVKTSTAFPSFPYAYANINVHSSISDFLPIGANVKIWDVSTGTVYSCNILQQFLDGQRIVTNISPSSLRTLGCTSIPANWEYENGDSMTVEVYFMPRTNIGGNILPKVYGIDFFVSDQPYGGTQYQCNPADFVLQHIGYAFYNNSFWSRYSMSGCNNGYSDFNHRARLGVDWNNRTSTDYFPYEVRAPFKPSKYKYIKKNDLEYTGRFLLRHYPLIINHPNQNHNLYIDDTNPYLTILGDTLIFDYAGWYDANNNNKVSLDQGFYTHMFAEVKANCDTDASFTYNKYFDHEMKMETDIRVHSKPEEIYTRENITDIRYTGGAQLAIQVVPNTRTAIQEVTCYSLDVVNGGNGRADNVFLSFESLSGGVVLKDVYETTNGQYTLLTPSNLGLYQIGTVNNGSNGLRTFDVCLQTNNCSKDSLLISTGWDCQSYPATVDEATCNISELIFVEPVRSELGMVVSSPTSETTLDLCDEVEYEIDISSADLGYLFDVNLWVQFPPKMKFVPGSIQMKYPITSNYVNISDPANPNGNVYTINLSNENTTLQSNGLPGTLDVGNNIVRIKLKAVSECNYSSGGRPRFLSFAYDACGRFANYRVSPGPRHYINGISQPFSSNIFIQDVSLDACEEDVSTVDISMDLASTSQNIGAGDSVRLILPEGVRYVANSYVAGNNAVSNQPTIELDNGVEIVYVDLENGVGAGSTVQFSLDIQAYDIGQECRDYDITVQAFNSQPATCSSNGANCNIRVISSEATRSVTIEKPNYEITWNNVQLAPLDAISNTLTYSVNVQNITGTPASSTTGVTVEIYQDTDGDGRYTSTDFLIGSDFHGVAIGALQTVTLTGSMNALTNYSCELLAVVRSETSCACSIDESFLRDGDLNFTFDRQKDVCSGSSVTFGPAASNGYTYEWVGLNGADVSVLSNANNTPTTLNYMNTTGNTIVWEYVLRTTMGASCYSFDTVEVTIHPEIDVEVTTGTCAGFPVTLNGPVGTTGSWFPTTNLVSPSNPNTTSSGVSATTTYTWTYTDVNGCTAYYRQTIALTGCSPSTMIGDYVWRDDNRNGIQDSGEPPLANVPVYLYDADNTSVPLTSTTSDGSGYYKFQPIPAGNYRIGFGNPYDYDVSTKDQGSNDDEDSDIDPVTRITDAILIANGDSVPTIDAGFMPMQKIGNYVWSDLDNDGIQDGNETGIEGVTVYLYRVGGSLVTSTTSNASGFFEFRAEPGDYYLVYDVSTNTVGINYVGVPQNAGGNTNLDSDANSTNATTSNFTVVAGMDRKDIDAGFHGVEDCSNGVDDDNDGDTDCADSECQPLITSVTTQIPTCVGGGSNGQIVITATGQGTLSYSINNTPVWQSSNTFNNLGSGQYTVRVRNDSGCITEYNSNPILFDIGTCIELCNDGIDNDGDGLVDCDDPDCDGVDPSEGIHQGNN